MASGSAVLNKHAIRVIYEEGVEAVEATIRQLYEMIEIEDERVQRMVCSATEAHLRRIEQLTTRINGLEEELNRNLQHWDTMQPSVFQQPVVHLLPDQLPARSKSPRACTATGHCL